MPTRPKKCFLWAVCITFLTGQEHDTNTGLIYFGARYYDPDTARFITQDTYLGQPGTPPSLHRYLYAYSNPTVYIDLYGYFSFKEIMSNTRVNNPMGLGMAIAKTEMQWVGRKIDQAVDQNPNYNAMDIAGATIIKTVAGLVEGAVNAPEQLANETIHFFSEPKFENLPVLGAQGKAIGQSWAKAVDEGGFVNYSEAIGHTLLGVTTAIGGVELARAYGLPGTYKPSVTAPNEVTIEIEKPKAKITVEDSTGIKNEIKAANELEPVEIQTAKKDAFELEPEIDAAKKPIVIGENMKRVQRYADEIGGHAYRPWENDPFDYDLGMKRNKRWIQDMKGEGREIIDIGPDFKRRSLGRDPSDFYNMERSQLKGYENYKKVFERTGKNSGGVPGLDF